MIEPHHPVLSTSRQCQLVGLPRSTFYRPPAPESEANLALLLLLDATHLQHPFFGSRQMTFWLRRLGHDINRKRVRRLMAVLSIETLYRRPRTSCKDPASLVHPYLLKGLVIDRPNQVWATDITYIPVRGGYAYLCAVMDWHSRAVLSWELSNTQDAALCVRVVKRALALHGPPEIFNSDQGSQFTSAEFTAPLLALGVRLSMDGPGRYLDNIFVERLWRTVKYEEVYLKVYDDLRQAERELAVFLSFYNEERPHRAHDGATPWESYRGLPPPDLLTTSRSRSGLAGACGKLVARVLIAGQTANPSPPPPPALN
jgi:putative transposase